MTLSKFIFSYQLRGKKTTWCLFLLFFSTLFVEVILSHWLVFHSFYISSFFCNPSIFWGFWLPKVSIALFLSLFIFITKRKWWTFVVLVMSNIWVIANLIYVRANNTILTWDAIMMASNLAGFGSSIGFYWDRNAIYLMLITLAYGLCLPFFSPEPRYKGLIASVAILICTYFIGAECCRINMADDVKSGLAYTRKNYIPFYIPQEVRHTIWRAQGYYCTMHSMIAYFPTICSSALVDALTEEKIVYTEAEETLLQAIVKQDRTINITPTHNLLFILVESLEAFSLEIKDAQNNILLPNLHAVAYGDSVLFANKIKSQVRHGVSADGQMITCTGLLPLQNGTAAMVYGRNAFPNYAAFYNKSWLSNPFFANTWNQDIVTYSYGFHQMLGGKEVIHDAETFIMMCQQIESIIDTLFCYYAITVDSHSPFDRVPHNPTLHFDAHMPAVMREYLTCLHYTDSCFGVWYNKWKETEQAKNTVLVITGDHTIFKDAMLQELMPYAQRKALSIATGKTYCPFIALSPEIKERIEITEECYQMDIFPTILHLIGAEDYYWKGFGVNLLDTVARHNRTITESEAYILSDKLIRNNYFNIPPICYQ